MQTRPQAPQFAASCCKSTQEPSHEVCAPHSLVHWPLRHTWPAAQALPQSPQLSRLELTSTHWPPQALSPALQATPHVPRLQTAAPPATGGQALSHAPQLAGSLSRLRHSEPQRW
jgi:hypothetical protein